MPIVELRQPDLPTEWEINPIKYDLSTGYPEYLNTEYKSLEDIDLDDFSINY